MIRENDLSEMRTESIDHQPNDGNVAACYLPSLFARQGVTVWRLLLRRPLCTPGAHSSVHHQETSSSGHTHNLSSGLSSLPPILPQFGQIGSILIVILLTCFSLRPNQVSVLIVYRPHRHLKFWRGSV